MKNTNRFAPPAVRVRKSILCWTFLSLLIGGSSGATFGASHGAEKAKHATGKEVVSAFLHAFSHSGKEKSADSTFAEVSKSMDFDEMVRRSFGNKSWAKFSESEKKEFLALFKRLIQIRYYPRWSRIFQSGHFDSKTETKAGKDVLVAGTLKLDGKENQLSFRLVNDADGLKLVSMAVEDKDLLERTSAKLKRGLAHKGTKGLIAHLQKKTSEPPKELSAKAHLDDLISGSK